MFRRRRNVRVPYVAQLEAAECGPACLTMLLQYYGAAITLSQVRHACGAGRDGATLAKLGRVAAQWGYRPMPFRSGLAGLSSVPAPAILHWGFNHFVVLERADARSARIVDPTAGRRTVSLRELSDSFTGVGLALRVDRAQQQRPYRAPLKLAEWLGVLRTQGRALGVLAASVLALEFLGLGVPVVNQFIVDRVALSGRSEWLLPALAVLVVAGVGEVVMRQVQRSLLLAVDAALELEVLARVAQRMMQAPLGFVLTRSTGELAHRMQLGEQVCTVLRRCVQNALNAVLAISMLALLYFYLPWLATVATVLVGARIVLYAKIAESWTEYHASQAVARGRELAIASEGLGSREVVFGLGIQRALTSAYKARLAHRLNGSLQHGRASATATLMLTLFDVCRQAAVLGLGAFAVIERDMTLGALISFLTVDRLLQDPVERVMTIQADLAQLRGTLPHVEDVPVLASVQPQGAENCCLELRNVGFAYSPDSPPLLRDVNLRIHAGERIAIIGAAGSGKTTLARLICGLLSPTSGVVSRATAFCEPGTVELVPSEPVMLAGTVLDNLLVGRQVHGRPAVERACYLAAIDEFVGTLPDAYETLLTRGGSNLSGGQRQRFALARALVASPSLLVLDEATAHLDTETEALLLERLRGLPATVIFFTHRPSTLLSAQRVFRLEAGLLGEVPAPSSHVEATQLMHHTAVPLRAGAA